MGSLRRTLTAGILFTLCVPGAAAGAAAPAAGHGRPKAAASLNQPTDATREQPAVVPYQYIAKAYTELLGRAPGPVEWANAVGYFRADGCSAASLRRFGDTLLSSTEYRHDYPPGPQTAGAIVLTLYRFVLNREPDAAGYVENRDEIASRQVSPLDAAGDLYETTEFTGLTEPAICDPTNPNYYFGEPGNWTGYPAIETPDQGNPGPDGDEATLQAALDARSAAGGGGFALPARSVTGLTTTLVVPGNVTLTTVGDPDPDRYAEMGRLVRLPGFGPLPDYSGDELVRLQPGAKLEHVWVDGQRDTPSPNGFLVFDVRMLGGAGTTVRDDRIGNPYGASDLEDDSTGSNVPGATACTGNVVSDNLVEAYGSTHVVPTGSPEHPEADGLGIYCQDTTVAHNDIVDISDTAVALFDGASFLATTRPQHSRVVDNTVVSAGNSYSFGIATDPSYALHQGTAPGGDQPGATSRSFAGTVIADNRFWSGTRTHIDVVLSSGTHDLFGSTVHQNCALPDTGGQAECGGGRNALGATWTANSTGGQLLEAEIGIYVGGTVDATFRANDLSRLREVAGGFCPHYPVVVAIGDDGAPSSGSPTSASPTSASPSGTVVDFATGFHITGLAHDDPAHHDATLQSDSCVNPFF